MKTGIALDIDETLSWTIGKWVKEMQILFGNPENLTLHELIAKYKYSQNVPYWQTPQALEWMESKRNDNDFQIGFDLMPRALEGVLELNKIIPIIAYLTIRPQSVKAGTNEWLKKHGFPDAEVIARPDHIPHTEGNKWKAKKMESMYPKVQGIVDDNAEILKHLPTDYKGHIFLFAHNTLPTIHTPNTYTCPDWDSVIQRANAVFNRAK